MKFEKKKAECSVPWLNEVLVLLTVALQLCQQLKDKVRLKHFNLTFKKIILFVVDFRVLPVQGF